MYKFILIFIPLAFLGVGCTSNRVTRTVTQPVSTETKTLDLSNRKLEKIPSEVFAMKDLENLNLSGNKLSGAPQAEIRNLKNLRVLDLHDNALTGLPAELGQLANLVELNVSNNALTGLPLELGNLTQLQLLDVSGNDYSTIDLDQITKKLPNTRIVK